MSRDEIIQAWLDVIRLILPNRTVIRSESLGDAPRPNTDYITVKILSGPTDVTAKDSFDFNESQDSFDISGRKRYTISVQAFRGSPFDDLLTLRMQLENPEYIDFLKDQANIATTLNSGVLDVSSLLDTGYERRASLDIFFNTVHNVNINIGVIESVNVSGTLTNPDGSTINTDQTIIKE